MTDRYAFIGTVKRSDEFVALIADREKVSDSDISSMRQAFNAHARITMRDGVLTLAERGVIELKRHVLAAAEKMPRSLEALDRAVECIQRKKSAAA